LHRAHGAIVWLEATMHKQVLSKANRFFERHFTEFALPINS
jgi:hypothetical protein